MKKYKPNSYQNTGAYSWTKKKAEERAEQERKKGFNVKIVKAKTRNKKKTGYAFFAQVNEKGTGWKKRK